MPSLDAALLALQRFARARPLLYRLTVGTRVLLAAGFIPTGMVKLLGERFTTMSPETPIGAFFEVMYQSGLYWRFLGATQVLAGIAVLVPATATLGALAFFGVILNIFVITLSYDFHGTPLITGAMLLATGYLLVWDYHRWRGILPGTAEIPALAASLPTPRLRDRLERAAYVVGAVAGIGFFAGVRGLAVPRPWNLPLLAIGAASVLLALYCGLLRREERGRSHTAAIR